MRSALTIAGSDSGGGAGIQADLKTFAAHGVFGTSVITAVTAQNTLGVTAFEAVSADLVTAQLEAVMSDIAADAAKTGMLATAAIVEAVAAAATDLEIPLLVVDPVNAMLYEFFHVFKRSTGWEANCQATFDLKSNKMRPRTWTSADAAGLPILPLLATPGRKPIKHAIRVTVSRSRSSYVWPARHQASDDNDPSLPRMGERLRLKASVDIARFPRQARRVARAMQTYGVIVADNGSDWFISGSPSRKWNNDQLHALDVLSGRDFEVVDTGR